ncbi:MAG: hypothetical protein H6R18_675 [Proteobacteria bacterium]|nr:hypothetical protein [Pseudomonadota bacterium]
MNTFVHIDNFRGFSKALIPLKEVNFLVGENSTGKTSFLELVETFSNIMFWVLDPKFGIPGAQQKHFLDLVSAESDVKKTFTIGAVEISNDAQNQSNGMLITYENQGGRPVPSRITVVSGESVRSVEGKLWKARMGTAYKSRIKELRPTENGDLVQLNAIVELHNSPLGFSKAVVPEELEGTPILMRFEKELFEGKGLGERKEKAPSPFMRNFVDLAPIRTKPRRTYDAPQTGFSPEGEHTPYVIKRRLSNKIQAAAFQAFLEQAGKSSGLFKSISVKPYGTGPQAPFEMKIVLSKASLSLENVGYGVSQALPVLVEMFVRPKGAAFTIQQPEVHLHPKAQATFGDLIAELARLDEKVFFVETHSDFTIDRFRLNVRQTGKIPSQLLFFERSEAGNTVTPIAILENGDLCADQPDAYRSFFFNESLSILS